jgi:hypothetical protein
MFFICSIQSFNIPVYARGFNQVHCKEYIFWIQVKIHISDQASLKICNSVAARTGSEIFLSYIYLIA